MARVETPPPRGTRPRNRVALTIDAATELFYRRGYPSVSMGDIAQRVNVGASAIYRHFSSKSELLAAAIHTELEPFTALLRSEVDAEHPREFSAVTRDLAELALDHRQLGVLWQREARNLDEAQKKQLRDALRATTTALAELIRRHRPSIGSDDADLLGWCAMSALVSISFHTLELPREDYLALLVELVTTVVALDLTNADESESSADRAALGAPTTRRDEVVAQATELFAERGFGAVGMDDIGDAVGIAGPSLYSHFPGKQTILMAAVQQGVDVLQSDAASAREHEGDPRRALSQLVDSYIRVAVTRRFLLRVVLSEMDQLEPRDRETARRDQREYVDIWATLFRDYSGADPIAARIRVQAVLLVVNDAAQTRHLRNKPDFARAIRQIAEGLLLLPQASTAKA